MLFNHFFIQPSVLYYYKHSNVSEEQFTSLLQYQEYDIDITIDEKTCNITVWFYLDDKLIASIHIFF